MKAALQSPDSHLRTRIVRLPERVLGSWAIAGPAAIASRKRLRVLAYHDVSDETAFEGQLHWLIDHFEPVTQEDVIGALRGESALPERSVWLTFDDGSPSVIERGRAVLDPLGISATLFICPGLVDTTEPFWWEVVHQAESANVELAFRGEPCSAAVLVRQLKHVTDAERRDSVQMVAEAFGLQTGRPPMMRQPTTVELSSWVDAGHSLGNHTWDHPCLTSCTPQEQAEQITRGQVWLQDRFARAPHSFAYPNGDWTPAAQECLHDVDCPIAVLFDHRLETNPPRDALRVSRLRVSAGASLSRFRALISGAHSTAYDLRSRFSRRR